jgi:LmbE family N-acetylglucosaminyl deacetylase
MKLRWPQAQHLYLSPHPDDVVLSCGGMIWQQVQRGETVAVVTIFAASPSLSSPLSSFAQSLHDRWHASAPPGMDFSDPPAVRRAEDQRAFEALDPRVQLAHFPLADCIYRIHPVIEEALYASEEAIFGEVHPADPAKDSLATLAAVPSSSIVYSPLAVGHHVDHQIVRTWIDGWGLDADRVRYYEDYPYVTEPGALEAVIGQHQGWVPSVIPLGEPALQAKIRAVIEHASQISTFWEGVERMKVELRAHTEALGGERLWIEAGARWWSQSDE